MLPSVYECLSQSVSRDGATVRDAITLNLGADKWAEKCLEVSEGKELLLNAIDAMGVGNSLDKKPTEFANDLRNWVKQTFKDELHSVAEEGDSRRDEKITRIGFPLHLRILRDIAQEGPSWDDGQEIVEAWNLPEASGGGWYWQQMFRPDRATREDVVATRTVAVLGSPGDSKALVGILQVAILDWPSDIPTPNPRLVPHPGSFGFVLDADFVQALNNAQQYLTNELKIWPDNIVLEWSIDLEVTNNGAPVPVLSGGSAGAALTLAAGSLLAKHTLRK